MSIRKMEGQLCFYHEGKSNCNFILLFCDFTLYFQNEGVTYYP
jgi:hypothetical protein